MKIHYMPQDALRQFGFDTFSPITLKGGETVDAPDKADVVVLPLALREVIEPQQAGAHLDRYRMRKIVDHFKLDERRVVAYDCSDYEEDYQLTPNCLFIRCNTKGWMKRKMPRTISWPWPVEDFKDIVPLPEGGFKFDVSGHMWITSSNVRYNACNSVRGTFKDRADLVTRDRFYGYIERDHPDEAKALKAAFKESMRVSRLSLCPASIHSVFPYRFFEAMSAGRVPVLFCTDFVLPWQDEIDWDACTFRFTEAESVDAGPLMRKIITTTGDKVLEEMGRKGRAYWDRWLNRDRFAELMYDAVERVMKKDGLLR